MVLRRISTRLPAAVCACFKKRSFQRKISFQHNTQQKHNTLPLPFLTERNDEETTQLTVLAAATWECFFRSVCVKSLIDIFHGTDAFGPCVSTLRAVIL